MKYSIKGFLLLLCGLSVLSLEIFLAPFLLDLVGVSLELNGALFSAFAKYMLVPMLIPVAMIVVGIVLMKKKDS